jgi:hypothetical protein
VVSKVGGCMKDISKGSGNYRKQFISNALFFLLIYISTVLALFMYTGKYDWNIFQSTALLEFAIITAIALVIIVIIKLL